MTLTSYTLETQIAEVLSDYLGAGFHVATSATSQTMERPFVLVSSLAGDDAQAQFAQYGRTLNTTMQISAVSGNSNDQNWQEAHREMTQRLTYLILREPEMLRGPLHDMAVGYKILSVWPMQVSAQTLPNSQIDSFTVNIWQDPSLTGFPPNAQGGIDSVKNNFSIRHNSESLLAQRISDNLSQSVKDVYQVVPAFEDSDLAENRIVVSLASAEIRINYRTSQTASGATITVGRPFVSWSNASASIALTTAKAEIDQHNEVSTALIEAFNASIDSFFIPSSGSFYRYIEGNDIRLVSPLMNPNAAREYNDFSITDTFDLSLHGLLTAS